MARHKDIDRASSLLEGSQGWIIENHPEAITNPNIKRTKRSRSKCHFIIMDFAIMLMLYVWVFPVVRTAKNYESKRFDFKL